MALPDTYTQRNDTGCCAYPDWQSWDSTLVEFDDVHFIRKYTRNFFHIPVNMGSVMTALQKAASESGLEVAPTQAMTLSRDLSPWKSEHLYRVSGDVPGQDNITLSGEFFSLVCEGNFSDVGRWYKQLVSEVLQQGRQVEKIYSFYTLCPKCAKVYGKNFIVMLAQLEPVAVA